jgi:type I restriction enzyme S subunit
MRSNYKSIGPYIRKVDERNILGKEENLLGVSVSKVFMKSIANTVGTDFAGYRVVRRNQFTYIPDTSRRGDKIGIALLDSFDEGLVSQAYTVFEVLDPSSLDPEYLMLWFRRPEFDRYARFISHGSVREIFEWEDMCNVFLPMPPVGQQREIVAEYKVVQERIRGNDQVIQKIEEAAKAIYRYWFVEFEFPDENGKPYKSSGGKMIDSDLGEIPQGWIVMPWSEIGSLEYGRSLKAYRNSAGSVPVYGTNGRIGSTEEPMVNSEGIVIGRKGIYRGVHYSPCPFYVIDTAFYFKPIKDLSIKWAFFEICRFDINGMETGSAIPSTSREDFYSLTSAFPVLAVHQQFESVMRPFFVALEVRRREGKLLNVAADLLLSKLATIEG